MKKDNRKRLEQWLRTQQELKEHTEAILEAVERAEVDSWLSAEPGRGTLDHPRRAS